MSARTRHRHTPAAAVEPSAVPTALIDTAAKSDENEALILGLLMLEPWREIGPELRAESFASAERRRIFEAITRLAGNGRPFDVVAVADELDRMGATADVMEALGDAAVRALVAREQSADKPRSGEP
ncbi:MAG: hypothetical protein IRZ28_13185 [Steroidobacteraceae bacterium]|nr:hypothetical protein [Steroidobacteraceae bacterium]